MKHFSIPSDFCSLLPRSCAPSASVPCSPKNSHCGIAREHEDSVFCGVRVRGSGPPGLDHVVGFDVRISISVAHALLKPRRIVCDAAHVAQAENRSSPSVAMSGLPAFCNYSEQSSCSFVRKRFSVCENSSAGGGLAFIVLLVVELVSGIAANGAPRHFQRF